MTGHLNVRLLDADLNALDAASKGLLAFTSGTIAHTSSKAIGKHFNLTFNDLDSAIDLLEKLTIAYRSLLTGKGSTSLIPVEQYDWYEQFTFAWRPRDRT